LLIAGALPAAVLRALEPVQRSAAALLHRQSRRARPAHADMLRSALRSAGIFVWEWDLDAGRLSGAEDGMRALGYPGVGQTREEWTALIHPEDREANRAAFRRHVSGEAETCEQAYRTAAEFTEGTR
jgi:PAS domain-containing protein